MCWAKTLLSFTLICYLSVSSIAAVHAFPSQSNSKSGATNGASISDTSMPEMMPSCHQEAPGISQDVASTCDIFCAAMTNVISNDITLDLQLPSVSAEFAFVSSGLLTREPAMEPHPPK